MANVNARNLPDEVHRAIRIQAGHHGLGRVGPQDSYPLFFS